MNFFAQFREQYKLQKLLRDMAQGRVDYYQTEYFRQDCELIVEDYTGTCYPGLARRLAADGFVEEEVYLRFGVTRQQVRRHQQECLPGRREAVEADLRKMAGTEPGSARPRRRRGEGA